jgi:hypothetical protein
MGHWGTGREKKHCTSEFNTFEKTGGVQGWDPNNTASDYMHHQK